MRFITFFIALFVTQGCLLGGLHAKHPLENFGAIIILWFVWYQLTQPGRRRRQYWRNRRNLEDQCMRTYLRQNGHWY
jgi:hypothetical protein